MAARASNRMVQVINLGRMGFLEAYDVQMRYARPHLDEIAGRPNAIGHNTLLLVEHNPVYTVGLRTKDYGKVEERRLKSVGAEFYRTNRGGLITFHGPGQLVAYPILNLRHLLPTCSLRTYVATLERTLMDTCQRFGVQAHTTEHTGVWVGEKKIGSIGIHASRYVTTHGVSLNCNTDLGWYRHIVPCGIPNKEVTSLSAQLGRDVSIRKAVAPFLQAFQNQFDCELEYGLFDAEDTSLLRGEEGGSGKEGSIGSPPSMQAAQQGVRLLSTSASSSGVAVAPSSSSSSSSSDRVRPRASMW